MDTAVLYNYHFWLTDLVRPAGQPDLVNELTSEMYSDLEDFQMACLLRYYGICKHYPDAEIHWETPWDMYVSVCGLVVYRKTLYGIDPMPQVLVDFSEEDA